MALRTIWQLMNRDVTDKILYEPKRSWGPHTILWVTDRSMNCHLARSTMNYLLYYTHYMQICHRWHVFVIVYLRQKTSSDKIRKKTLYWSGPVHILKYWPVNIRKYWPAALTKTNREDKNVKYNIIKYYLYVVHVLYTYLLVIISVL